MIYVIVWVSVAVITPWPNTAWGRKGYFQLTATVHHLGCQSWDLEAGTEAAIMEECHLLACFMACHLIACSQLAFISTICPGMAPPTIINQGSALQTCLQANTMEAFFSTRIPTSKICLSLCGSWWKPTSIVAYRKSQFIKKLFI